MKGDGGEEGGEQQQHDERLQEDARRKQEMEARPKRRRINKRKKRPNLSKDLGLCQYGKCSEREPQYNGECLRLLNWAAEFSQMHRCYLAAAGVGSQETDGGNKAPSWVDAASQWAVCLRAGAPHPGRDSHKAAED